MRRSKMGEYFSLKDVLNNDVDECGWQNGTARNLNCPVCGDNFQHVGKDVGEPRLIDGQNAYAAWDGKGDLVVVPVVGECGHKWELCFGFHKGNTAAFARTLD